MAKRARTQTPEPASPAGAVGPREPCPCGSGRRYKACHGGRDGGVAPYVKRPFAGLAGECDIVALRELVPAASAPVSLSGPAAANGRAVLLCSLLPAAAPALVREDGTVWLGLQVQHHFGDPSRDLGAVLVEALAAEPGDMVGLTEPPGQGPRLQDLVADEPLEVTVHEGFDFWVADREDPDGTLRAALEQANAAAAPTAKLTGVPSAYWTDAGGKEHLRWVMPHDEEDLLAALARLHAAGEDRLTPDSRLVGMFRTHGLLVPVWDLPPGTGPDALEEAAERVARALEDALGLDAPLSTQERAARSGLANRQVTIR